MNDDTDTPLEACQREVALHKQYAAEAVELANSAVKLGREVAAERDASVGVLNAVTGFLQTVSDLPAGLSPTRVRDLLDSLAAHTPGESAAKGSVHPLQNFSAIYREQRDQAWDLLDAVRLAVSLDTGFDPDGFHARLEALLDRGPKIAHGTGGISHAA